jgi:hypothetical protein
MGKVYYEIDQHWADFINEQKMFFVGTAPLSADGHVNLSPKGYDSFRILGPKSVAYLDLGGSGIETVAHLRENGRITFMFCAYEGAAKILRLYGKGTATCFDDPGFDEKRKIFPDASGARAIITVQLDRIQDACGWGVPFYEFKSERDQLQRYHDNQDQDAGRARRYEKNVQSIDGLPGLIKPESAK